MENHELIEKAKAGDTGSQWDLILQHAKTNASESSRRSYRRAIPLKRTPERRLAPSFDRDLALVDDRLLDVFRSLLTGKAPWPLFLFGPAGSGKTAASLALADVSETAGYWTVEDLGTFVMSHTAGEVANEWERLAQKDLVILDELGTRRSVSDLEYSVVKKLADVREMNAGRVAIFVSNLSTDELQSHYDDRLTSRLLCGTCFELNDRDRRQQR